MWFKKVPIQEKIENFHINKNRHLPAAKDYSRKNEIIPDGKSLRCKKTPKTKKVEYMWVNLNNWLY